MKVLDIPIDAIDIGERRRADYGDIAALAKGMKRVGLLEPIVVDRHEKRYRLIAGERRIRAARMLQWKSIAASLRERLTDAELRDIELEENDNRKSLTEAERAKRYRTSKRLVENARKAKEVLAQSAQKPNQKGTKGGRPKKPDAPQAVAEALGTDRRTVERAEQHVETAEAFPFMQDWVRSDVLAVHEQLAPIPKAEHTAVAGVYACARLMDPKSAKEIASTLAGMSESDRSEIYSLSRSEDPRDRSLALTRAAAKPPQPDPRLNLLDDAKRAVEKCVKRYPDDPLTPQFQEEWQRLQALQQAVRAMRPSDAATGGTIQ
jgi:ParB/RepB/Spo0J family partition protein